MTRPFFTLLIFFLALADSVSANGKEWMKDIPDRTPLTEITIPGTHNAGALHEPYPGTAQCQSLTITQQLDAGVRFLDFRCRHLKDQFHIYHGPINQKLTFAKCLNDLENFLKTHPSETVIVSINGAHQPKDNTRSFTATLQSYLKPDAWWLRQNIPTLGEARGKLILLRRFSSDEKIGLDATHWKSKDLHKTDHLIIQDLYKPADANAKWKVIQKAFQSQEKGKLLLNFTSGYLSNGLGIPNIKRISTPINKNLTAYFNKAKKRPHGIVILDFITPRLAAAIYKTQAPHN